MTYFLIVLTFGSGFLLVFGINLLIVDSLRAHRLQVRKRLEDEDRLRQTQRAQRFIARRGIYKGGEDMSDAPLRLTLWGRFVRLVDESGLLLRPSQVAMICGACGLFAGGIVALIWNRLLPHSLPSNFPFESVPFTTLVLVGNRLLLSACAVLAAALLPILYVLHVRKKRLAKLLSQLPEAFDLMGRSMRAGQTISQAMQAVADDFSSPVADEFGYCYDQQNLGLSPESAMRGLARRTGLLEIKIFVLAVMVHRQTGGNLADLLDKLSTVIRDRYRVRGAIQALTGEGGAQAAVLLALPPLILGILLVINRPYAAILFDYPTILVGTVVNMIFGAFWMHRIVNFDF